MTLRSILLLDLGGDRLFLYGLPLVALCIAFVVSVSFIDGGADGALQDSGAALARATARHHHLTEVKRVHDEELRLAMARAFADGEALGKKTRPALVLQGTTAPTTRPGPPEVGDVVVHSDLSSALVRQVDGKLYAKAQITTHVGLPRFKYEATFDQPVEVQSASVLDDVCPSLATPPPLSPGTTLTAPRGKRSLLGADGGLVLGAASAGYEVGGRYYPRSLAYSGRLGEVRLGAYVRVEQGTDLKVAAGASVLFGVGEAR